MDGVAGESVRNMKKRLFLIMLLIITAACVWGAAVYFRERDIYDSIDRAALLLEKKSYPVGVTHIKGRWYITPEFEKYYTRNGWICESNPYEYLIEVMEGGEWKRYGPDKMVYQPFCSVHDGQKEEFEVFSSYAGEEGPEPGKYRIVKYVNLWEDTGEGLKLRGHMTIYSYFGVV